MASKLYARTNASDLRKLLPHGAIKEIARRARVSRVTVSNVINEAESNPAHPVIKVAVAYVKEIGSADTQRELLALLAPTPLPHL